MHTEDYTVGDTANDLVNPTRLEAEIVALGLTSADYEGLDTLGPLDVAATPVKVHFDVEPDSTDKASLAAAVAAHTGAVCYCAGTVRLENGNLYKAISFASGSITWELVT